MLGFWNILNWKTYFGVSQTFFYVWVIPTCSSYLVENLQDSRIPEPIKPAKVPNQPLVMI